MAAAVFGRSSAVLSDCGTYRYELRRSWDPAGSLCAWVMLNPSMADADLDDPTIRRCRSFSRSWGYGGIVVVNLYVLRATDPEQLRRHLDPVADNDDYIKAAARDAGAVVCAWGAHPFAVRRAGVVTGLLRSCTGAGVAMHCLGTTNSGAPRHPLYVHGATPRVPFEPMEVAL